LELRLVQHEVRLLGAGAHEQELFVVGLEVAHRLHRRDLVGVEVVHQQRDSDTGVARE